MAVKQIKLIMDDSMHEELWRRKERVRRKRQLTKLTWENFFIDAVFKKYY